MCEGAAELRWNTEKGKNAVGDVQCGQSLGFGETGEGETVALIDADVLEAVILFAVDEIIGGRHVEVSDIDARSGVPDADEFGGARIGQRLEENAFEDAEDDGVSADTGSERDERNNREEGRASQAAEYLLQMVEKRAH